MTRITIRMENTQEIVEYVWDEVGEVDLEIVRKQVISPYKNPDILPDMIAIKFRPYCEARGTRDEPGRLDRNNSFSEVEEVVEEDFQDFEDFEDFEAEPE